MSSNIKSIPGVRTLSKGSDKESSYEAFGGAPTCGASGAAEPGGGAG